MVTIIIMGMETFETINDYDNIVVFDITMTIIFFEQVMANPQMKNTTNLLILNLAVADLLFVLVCVPFTASDYVLM